MTSDPADEDGLDIEIAALPALRLLRDVAVNVIGNLATAAVLFIFALVSGLIPETPVTQVAARTIIDCLPILSVYLLMALGKPKDGGPWRPTTTAGLAAAVVSGMGIVLTAVSWRLLDGWSQAVALPCYAAQLLVGIGYWRHSRARVTNL